MNKKGSVGLTIVDTESYLLANNAIQHSVAAYPFASVTIFTDRPDYWPQFRTVVIPKIESIEDYNRILLTVVPAEVDTDFTLVIQYDGFVIHKDAFSDEFFKYDYIGAVWPDYPDHRVGNGGFSWRSRRLMQTVAQHAHERNDGEAEDVFICRTLRATLESEYSCSFAPEILANQFSHEVVPSHGPTFGFHGLFHLPSLYSQSPEFLIDNLPDRAFDGGLPLLRYGLQQLPEALRQTFTALIDVRVHKLAARKSQAGRIETHGNDCSDLFAHLHRMAHVRSPDWKGFEKKPSSSGRRRVIAYYLPQFHTIPENDEYWGPGFTEWRNVARALPLYHGHYQPRHPADLGFYDLRNPEVMQRQADMARNYGLGGWAFYYYWFDGKKLLDAPIEHLYQHPEIDMPYCVFWANENWTRSWDGMQSNILLAQKHSPEDDIAFITSVSRYFADPRYIRRDGKAVMMMYRPQLLPDPRATTDRWRYWCKQQGLGEIYLIATEAYGLATPSHYGFDAAAEFPPHRGSACEPGMMRAPETLHHFGPKRDIQCIDYASAVTAWSRQPPVGSEKLFKCVFPMWDNSPRRVSSIPTVFQGASPELYQKWLTYCLSMADPEDFVFVNAWNEWAEGAYLEPDLHLGYAYLEATWQAIQECVE